MRFMPPRLLLAAVMMLCMAQYVHAQSIPDHPALIAWTNFADAGDGTLEGDISGDGWAGDGWTLQDATLGGAIVPVEWSHQVPDGGELKVSTALQFTGSPLGQGVQRALAEPVDGDDVFISFLTKWETGVVDGNDFVIWYFNNNGGPNIGYKSNEGSGDDGLDVVARTTGSTNQYSTDIEVGELYFVVGHLSKSVGGPSEPYDQFSLWVNPSTSDENDPDAVSEGASNVSVFSDVGVRSHQINDGGEEPDDLRFGALRIGSTWESVFPGGDAVTLLDFNSDGAIDMADYDILAANMYGHLDGSVSFADGDNNFDGRVDLKDFHEFVAGFPAQAGAAAVPEPSTAWLVVAPLIILLRRVRSSRRA